MISRIMTAIFTLGVGLTLNALPTVAIQKPNFTGIWALDQAKSDGLPPSVDQTVTIVQDGDKVDVATKTTSERGEQNSKSSYVLDGKEREATLAGPKCQTLSGRPATLKN